MKSIYNQLLIYYKNERKDHFRFYHKSSINEEFEWKQVQSRMINVLPSVIIMAIIHYNFFPNIMFNVGFYFALYVGLSFKPFQDQIPRIIFNNREKIMDTFRKMKHFIIINTTKIFKNDTSVIEFKWKDVFTTLTFNFVLVYIIYLMNYYFMALINFNDVIYCFIYIGLSVKPLLNYFQKWKNTKERKIFS